MSITVTLICPACEAEHEVDVNQTSPYRAARLYGAPEDCYPAEAAEYDVVGLGECECGEDMDTSANWSEAISRADEIAQNAIDLGDF